jgi:hypothetical protein
MPATKATPPASPRPTVYDWQALADQVKAEPYEWFQIAKMDYPSYISHLKAGRVKAFEDVEWWEFTSRSKVRPSDGKRVYTLYARYIGG